jgi:tetratricopeptide (TPR) repeat protein
MYALCLIESEDASKRNQALEIANRNFGSLPENLVAQASLGYIRLRLGSVDQAKPALAKAAQSPGTCPEIDFFVASLLKAMNKNEEAKQALDGALKHEGLFLYRTAAKKMLDELSGSELPAPAPNK